MLSYSRPASATTTSHEQASKSKKTDADASIPQEQVVILADQHLLELPLEALQVLQAEPIISLTRDFSLQMLSHRIFVEPFGRY